MDCVYMSLSNVVFVCGQVECSILNKYYLFQNGRALLKCRIFILLQLVIPTLKSHAATRQLRHVRAHCEQTFQDGVVYFSSLFFVFRFRAFCVVVEFHSSHSFAISPWIAPHFRMFIVKIRQVLTSLISLFASFRACCVVVEFHSSHSFANFAVFYSSFS